jgi:hypothetical protein
MVTIKNNISGMGLILIGRSRHAIYWIRGQNAEIRIQRSEDRYL